MYYKWEKLDYLLNNYMSATDVASAFGFKSDAMLTKMRRGQSNITTLHIDGLEKYFNIPTNIFDDEVTSEQEINKLIKLHKENKLRPKSLRSKVFPNDEKLFNKLKGTWYGYVYPSNPASAEHGIWEVKTIIADDYSVVDEPWGNAGYVMLGKNESLIVKESYDHNDLTVIRFSNRQVPSEIFRFVIVSNQNHTLYEMVNFGFFSRKQYSPEEAKEILGERENKQLKLDLDFNERLIKRTIVPQ
ncbi:MAG TPA: hypothetical protein ENK66_08450 [Arcobacter sp.]|nr:hypothetical protein [Arcobacter sp.]